MRPFALTRIALALLCLVALPMPGNATDVDGPNDCLRTPTDFGDAPENINAYPGVIGHFPTCLAPGLAGSMTSACGPGGPPPGLTGFVAHVHTAATANYWLGCGPAGQPPQGIDPEGDGKVNDTGAPLSACNATLGVDCTETAFGMTFGQDECYGSSDAGLASSVAFDVCSASSVTFAAFNCGPGEHQVLVNVLVDWNHDGDWNDDVQCAAGCAREWALRNVPVLLAPGCNNVTTPPFLTGPDPGPAWMRITISDNAAPPDFSWNGTVTLAGQAFISGETEDYPVTVRTPPPPCPTYEDWGDAPEEAQAYPGVPGNFPTCSFPSGTGTQDVDCLPISTLPGPTGFVRHLASPNDNVEFWLGCGDPGAGILGVDGEVNGKMNDTGLPPSLCDANLLVDCTEFFGINWGQDECYGDSDAGIKGPVLKFKTCQSATVDFSTYNCKGQADAFLNILVDMNEDGDWNDNFQCPGTAGCAYEWAVKNVPIPLGPGCEAHTSPSFLVGPRSARGWLRITITAAPVSDDFPWNGSAGPGGDGFFLAGETEDYPVMIRPDNVGVEDGPGLELLALAPLSPNPAKDRVMVRFTLPQAGEASLAAYDISGRRLADLAHGRLEAGEHRVTWAFTDRSGQALPAGYYMIRLQVGDRVITRRAIRVR